MYKIELNQTLCQIVKFFHHLGIWRNDEEPEDRKTVSKYFQFIYLIIFHIFLVMCALLTDDENESIFLTEIILFYVVIEVKFRYLLWEKNEILRFLYDKFEVFANADQEAIIKRNKKIGIYMKFAHMYLLMICATGCGCFFSCLPIFSNERMLPLFISFSIDSEYGQIIYYTTYMYVMSGLFYAVVINFFNVLIWYVMLNYSIEYEALGKQLKSLGVIQTSKEQLQASKQSKKRNTFKADLIGLIRVHQNIQDTMKRFKSFFSTLFMTQISTSSISICISSYNLAHSSHENVIQTSIFIATLFYVISDILLVMYLGNEIKVANNRLLYCLFESNWIEQSESSKKSMIILGEALKRPKELVIFIYPMSLETFTRIINGAYSMFNLLKNI